MPRATRSSSTAAPASARAFCGQNHLQQLVWVFKKISQLVALRSEYFRSQVGGYLDSCHRGIFLHVANFIYLDARLPRQRGFQLLRQRRRLGISARKRAHESRELRLRQPR
jgi:hypothetical protein